MNMANSTTSQDLIELVLGRAVLTEAGEHDSLAHLWWRLSPEADHVVQVYVNDELVDVGQDPTHPELWLILDRSQDQRIELLAVPRNTPELWWAPQPKQLNAWSPRTNTQTRVRLLREESLPIDTRVVVKRDGQTVAEGDMWPSGTPRSGFGGLFGLGAFGRDSATGLGLGRGELGHGPLGTDAEAWESGPIELLPGENQFTIHTTNAAGQEITSPQSPPPITVDPLPQPASELTISSDFILAWNS